MTHSTTEFVHESRCPACGRALRLVRVASHEQCAGCGLVWETCCEGGCIGHGDRTAGEKPEGPR